MSRILVTGFRPFGSIARNPSGDIAASLDGTDVRGARVSAVVLPVVRARALPLTLEAVARFEPKAVVALGLAADRDVVHVEAFARNLDDFENEDEGGERARARPVIPGGVPELAATLPAAGIADAIREAGIPVAPSRDAGAFLCNHLYYGLLHEAATRPPGRTFGCVFLHLPGVPECGQGPEGRLRPSRPFDETRRAVVAALEHVAGTLRP